jgi:transcriptional antiterminator
MADNKLEGVHKERLKRTTLSEEQKAGILKLNGHMTVHQIAGELNLSYFQVYNFLYKMNLVTQKTYKYNKRERGIEVKPTFERPPAIYSNRSYQATG